VRIQQQQGKLLQQTQQSEYASTKQTHMSQRVRPQSAVADCVDEMIRVTEEQAEAGALDLELE
jgi:cysteine synthase